MNTNSSQVSSPPSSGQTPAPNKQAGASPSASDVFAKLNSAEDPLKFVQENSKKDVIHVSGAVVTDPRLEEKPKEEAKPPEPEVSKDEPSFDFSFDDIPLEVKDEEEPAEEVAEGEGDELELEEEAETVGPRKSIRDLRKALNENKDRLQTVQTELDDTKQELERYRSGEVESEKIKEYEDRVSNLERYEKLHNLKLSKEYKQKYIDPLEKLKEQARGIAEDYGVNPSVFDQALQIENKKDLHAFLKQHFDDVGTLEARDTVLNLREMFQQIHEAEQKPVKELERLQGEFQQHEELAVKTRMTELANHSRSSWTTGLAELRSTGEYPELNIRANDDEHNKIAKPILQEAAKEFGNTVKLLVNSGAKDLSPQFLKMLAKRFMLSQASSIISKSRDFHSKRAEEVLNTTKRQSSLRRPPIGSTTNGVPAVQAKTKPRTIEEAAQRHIESIATKKA